MRTFLFILLTPTTTYSGVIHCQQQYDPCKPVEITCPCYEPEPLDDCDCGEEDSSGGGGGLGSRVGSSYIPALGLGMLSNHNPPNFPYYPPNISNIPNNPNPNPWEPNNPNPNNPSESDGGGSNPNNQVPEPKTVFSLGLLLLLSTYKLIKINNNV